MQEAVGIVGEFASLKADTEADVLAMQCGDFYEFFGPDAELVERELDLNVSEKSSGGETYPMAGVPINELEPYLQGLIERGYRVAIADQYETENGHAREVTRVVTPGTFIETTSASAQYLAAIVKTNDGKCGLAFAELSTGQFLVTSVEGEDTVARALAECHRYDPVEVILGPELRNNEQLREQLKNRLGARLTDYDAEAFAPGRARRAVTEQFGKTTLESLSLDGEGHPEVSAAGAIIAYARDTDEALLTAISRLTRIADRDHVVLDLTTQRNLELTEPMTDSGTSLFDTIDQTVTTPGRRQLREWLSRPHRDQDRLERRQQAVAALTNAALPRDALREQLSTTADIARLANQTARGSANARTVKSIARTLATFPEFDDIITGAPALADSPVASYWDLPERQRINRLAATLENVIRDNPPKTIREGGIFQRGYDSELDELIDEHEQLLEWIDTLADREQDRHNITHLQVDRNRTDGYYIQVGRSETDAVPADYREIKTLKQSKRYTTDELEDTEREILRIESARAELEYELFCTLRQQIADETEPLQTAGRRLGQLDTLASLATHAVNRGWTQPTLSESGTAIDIEAGRHPVVETTTQFVPNDTSLTAENGFLLVTGPNMSGKSTYLRQTALIVLLAQIGSFVPAERASIGIVDGIYTRVGALDELAHGRSTFMVEMQELSNILHSATADSLVILDEVGRGTATFDGMSIAWAATEYLHNQIRARTLFATHYHELTELADRLPNVRNVHVAVDERGGDVTFLRTIESGPADRSYGIHVAKLAGVPKPVTDRATEVLTQLREDNSIEARGAETSETVQAVFDANVGGYRAEASANGDNASNHPPQVGAVLSALRSLDVSRAQPVEVLAMVAEWQDRLKEVDDGQ